MRALRSLLALAAIAFAVTSPPAQQPAAPAAPAAPSAVQLVLDSLRLDPNGVTLGSADVEAGPRVVAAGQHVTGSIASWKGPLEIRGLVDGNAVAIGGDVIIAKGGRVRGDALSVGGEVRMDGGTVDGERRTISAATTGIARPSPLTPRQAFQHSVSLSVGWYLVLALIGFGVLLVARAPLDAVAEALRAQPARAFAVGLLGQVGLAPAFTLLIVALAITLIGLVIVPFAAVGFAAATAGALALGFLAVAMLGGQSVAGTRNGERSFSAALQPLLLGLSFFLILWVAGTAFEWTGGLGTALRMTAVLITWTAATAGFGAVIITRAGTRTAAAPAQIPPAATAEHEWQTPTPVTGVVAARRPTPAPRQGTTDR